MLEWSHLCHSLVGWNQKDFPSLHGKFHIGDQLISVCNIKVTSAAMAHKMLKHPTGDTVEMLVRRTPHALVLAIRRMAEGQNIGIKRNGGTAEVSQSVVTVVCVMKGTTPFPCMHVHTHTCTHTHTRKHMHAHACTHTHAHACTHTHTHQCTHTHAGTCAHTHTLDSVCGS